MPKNQRFSFGKVALWMTLINVFFAILMLILVFYVKLPYQSVDRDHLDLTRFGIRMGASALFQCLFYYFALNRYYRLMREKAAWKKYVLWSGLYFLVCSVYTFLNDLTVRQEEFRVALDISMKIYTYTLSTIVHIGISTIVAAIFWQLDEKRAQARNQIRLEERTTRLEKEKMQADYLFLKAQINPHFLHNTLNFLYSRSLPHSAELSEGILTLSEIMRYSLENQDDGDGKVLLTREIEHLRNVIRIQQLRFDNSLQVVFDIQGEPTGRRILPFVLITLVENAFKHGDLKNTANPVRLNLDIGGNGTLNFICSNGKKKGPKELSTGIGLDNTRRRLELAYGENYSLYIKDQRDLFTVHLTITL